MRFPFLSASAVLTAALFFAGCNNTPDVPADSRPQAKADSKKDGPPPAETGKDVASSAKVAEPWGTVTGRVTWADKDLPNRPALTVTADVAHCTSKGPIPDETWVVNKANKGVKNVFVWLQDANDPKANLPIHPSLKEVKVKEVVIDQPCCKFEPRVLTLREGQVLIARNSSPVNHNMKWTGETDVNDGDNKVIPAGGKIEITLKGSLKPVIIECNIHPWMKGWVYVFGHPYYALTDADGKFEIKDAPAGKYNLVMRHEDGGWVGGGKNGKPVEIKAGGVTEVNETTKPAAE